MGCIVTTISALTLFIERNRNEHVFKGWHKNCVEHVQSILTGLINKHAFISTAADGFVDGIGIVMPLNGENEFYITQLLCTNAKARRSVIGQFMQTYPKATIAKADRKGKVVTYNLNRVYRLITK